MKVKTVFFPEFDHVFIKVEFKKRIYYILSFYDKRYREMFEVRAFTKNNTNGDDVLQ